MNTTTIVAIILALVCGLAVGWLLASRAAAGDAHRQRMEHQAELERANETLSQQFRALSTEAAATQQRTAEHTASQTLASAQRMMDPVSQALRQLDQRLLAVEKERTDSSASLKEQISGMRDLNESLRKETASLSTALRRPQVRGAWGEMQLQRIAELAGMLDHCDFRTQSTTTANGTAQRPDMTVYLAGNRCVHIDAKTPLEAFLDAAATDDPQLQREQLGRFVSHVRTHITQLSSKKYWATDVTSPQFVVLFLPSDALLQAALSNDPSLHEYASSKDIVLASPSILIPMLRVIALAWRQESIVESATEIAELGRQLHARLSTVADHLTKMGKSLTSSVEAYNSLVGSLESRVMVSARKFEDVQATRETLPTTQPVTSTTRPLTAPEFTDPAFTDRSKQS